MAEHPVHRQIDLFLLLEWLVPGGGVHGALTPGGAHNRFYRLHGDVLPRALAEQRLYICPIRRVLRQDVAERAQDRVERKERESAAMLSRREQAMARHSDEPHQALLACSHRCLEG